MARTQAADYEERRIAIIDKAAELFAAKGFLGTSVMDIAKACNASKSLLYHYFPSKEDVLFGVMASHIDGLADCLGTVLESGGDARHQLHELLLKFMAEYVGAANRQKVLLNELENLPEANRVAIIGKQRRIVDAVQAMLAQVHPELAGDPARARVLAMLLFGMINWTGNWYDPAGPVSPQEIADMAYRMAITPV